MRYRLLEDKSSLPHGMIKSLGIGAQLRKVFLSHGACQSILDTSTASISIVVSPMFVQFLNSKHLN